MNITLSHKDKKKTLLGIWVRNPENLHLLIFS